MKYKTLLLIMFVFLGCSVISYADEGDVPYDEVDTYEEFIESYEKVPIEIQSFNKDTRILTGYSISGAMVTIDTGESVTVGNDGEFQFKIPKEIRMVIINAVDEEGMGPNSISYNVEENKIINEEDETPVPNIEEIKRNDETKQEKKTNEKQNNKEKSKKIAANTSGNNKKKTDTSTSESQQKNTKSSQTTETESTKKLKITDEKVKEDENIKNKKKKKNYWWFILILLSISLVVFLSTLLIKTKLKKKQSKTKKRTKGSLKKAKKRKKTKNKK